jgi:peroxiredoxin
MSSQSKRLVPILLFAALPIFGQEMKIKVGDVAPDFTLLHYDGQGVKPVSLHDFKGKKNVVVAFFVFAFTGG